MSLAPFAALSAAYFAHIGFFNPYSGLWLQELGLGLAAIGVLTSVQAATRVVAPYAWGWLSDRTGQRVGLLRASAAVAAVAAAGLAWEPGLGGLLLVLALMFIHTSGMMPLAEAAMAQHLVRDGVLDAQAYGRVRLWGSLGFGLTVVAAGAWFERMGLRSFPLWAVGTLLAVWAAASLLPREPQTRSTRQDAAPRVGPVLRQPAVRWLLAAVFWHVLAHVAVYAFFSLHLHALGYSKAAIGGLWAVSVVCEVLWFATQGRWLPALRDAHWLLLAAALMLLRLRWRPAWAGCCWPRRCMR